MVSKLGLATAILIFVGLAVLGLSLGKFFGSAEIP